MFRRLLIAVFSLLAGVVMPALAAGASVSPEQMRFIESLSPEQQRELAGKAGLALPASNSATVSDIQPAEIKKRAVGTSRLEKMSKASGSDAAEKESVASVTAHPVEEVWNQLGAEALEARRAFGDFTDEAKPMRVNTDLKQFGYELFAGSPDTFAPATDVPVPAEYVLGPGDELNIQLYGRENSQLSLTVDREGEISFPSLGPLSVAGMNFGDAKAYIAQQIKEKMVGITADISMGKLRSIRIFALGDVERPGSYTVSGLSTISNALFVSGGIKKTGSLRNIHLKRAGKVIGTIDLYDFLLKGDTGRDKRLMPGDVVFVPPIGKTAGVAGQVVRPAIYELKYENTISGLIGLSGGLLPTAYKSSALIERITKGGDRSVIKVSLAGKKLKEPLKNGDLLKVFSVTDHEVNPIYLLGHVKRPGKYAWHEGIELIDILPSMADLLPEVKQDYALVERETGENREPSILHFNLYQVLNKKQGLKLMPRDKVYVFSTAQLRQSPVVNITGSVKNPGKYELKKNMHLLDLIMAAGGVREDADLSQIEFRRITQGSREAVTFRYSLGGQNQPEKQGEQQEGELLITFSALDGDKIIISSQNPTLHDADHVIIHSRYEKQPKQVVRVTGEVNSPSEIEFASNMRISDLVFAGGNLTERAYLGTAELTRYVVENGEKRGISHQSINLKAALAGDEEENILLQPFDVLNIRTISNWRALEQVELKGEFRFPGVYPIEEGETLSSLIERAGGYSEDAYLPGAVFSRQSIRQQQQREHEAMVAQIEQEISLLEASLVGIRDAGILAGKQKSLAGAKQLLEKMKQVKPTGRLVIKLSELKKLRHSEFDVRLRDGDRIHIPSTPSEVLVIGQVYSATALLYNSKLKRDDYINLAGGPTRMADEDGIYIVRANGAVDAGKRWGRRGMKPGDTIVVPEDLEQFNLLDSTLDWSKVLMQVGIFSASMVAVGVF